MRKGGEHFASHGYVHSLYPTYLLWWVVQILAEWKRDASLQGVQRPARHERHVALLYPRRAAGSLVAQLGMEMFECALVLCEDDDARRRLVKAVDHTSCVILPNR